MSKELEYWSISNPLFQFGKREHRGGLEESLATSVQITEQEFKELLNNKDNDYEHYCLTVKEKIRNTEEEFDTLKRWVKNV